MWKITFIFQIIISIILIGFGFIFLKKGIPMLEKTNFSLVAKLFPIVFGSICLILGSILLKAFLNATQDDKIEFEAYEKSKRIEKLSIIKNLFKLFK